MRAVDDTQVFTGIMSDTTPFTLVGGQYGFSASVTANWSLQKLLPDNLNWFSMTGAGSGLSEVIVLPPGSYRLHINNGTPTGDGFEIVRF
jgi:hypothetical protein